MGDVPPSEFPGCRNSIGHYDPNYMFFACKTSRTNTFMFEIAKFGSGLPSPAGGHKIPKRFGLNYSTGHRELEVPLNSIPDEAM